MQRDEDLLAFFRKGSEEAFTLIYEQYHKVLFVLPINIKKHLFFERRCTASFPETPGVALIQVRGLCDDWGERREVYIPAINGAAYALDS